MHFNMLFYCTANREGIDETLLCTLIDLVLCSILVCVSLKRKKYIKELNV